MTVAELKKILERYDDDLKVVFGYNSRDYWNTIVAQEVEEVEETKVSYSPYHDKYMLKNDEDKEEVYETVLFLQ
jgi:hypothetical protein